MKKNKRLDWQDSAIANAPIFATNTKAHAVPTFRRPETPQEALRFLADWFDAVYPPKDDDDIVQNDLRRFADVLDGKNANSIKTIEQVLDEENNVALGMRVMHKSDGEFAGTLSDMMFFVRWDPDDTESGPYRPGTLVRAPSRYAKEQDANDPESSFNEAMSPSERNSIKESNKEKP